MNNSNHPLTKNALRNISESKSFDTLWAACLKIIKEMNFEYFAYRIQQPTPFTKPEAHTYGNYPLDIICAPPKTETHTTTGQFKIKPEHLVLLNQKQINAGTTKLNDSIFFITQSSSRAGGLVDFFFLARTHYKIPPFELKNVHALTKIMAKEIHQTLSTLNHDLTQIATLSPREKEILLWAADGKTSDEIAIILGLSRDSVNFHHKTIKKKTGTTNRAQAIAHAIVKGYI